MPCLETGLCKLDVPVAVNVPDKVVQILYRNAKLVAVKISGNILYKVVVQREYPLVLDRKLIGKNCALHIFGQIHKDIS